MVQAISGMASGEPPEMPFVVVARRAFVRVRGRADRDGSLKEKQMNLIVLVIILFLLFGGGGYWYGGPYVGGGLGTVLLVVLIVLLLRG